MPKLSVIGLDGVNWTILNHAMEKGLMPNLKQILDAVPIVSSKIELAQKLGIDV